MHYGKMLTVHMTTFVIVKLYSFNNISVLSQPTASGELRLLDFDHGSQHQRTRSRGLTLAALAALWLLPDLNHLPSVGLVLERLCILELLGD